MNKHIDFMKYRKPLAGLISGLMVCAPGTAIAEAGSSGHALEEVVVTARKREENLQDTPLAVTALTAEALDRRMITGTEGLGQVTPNLQFATYGPLTGNNSASQVFIRGIGQTDAKASVDPGVGLYIDDVYMGSSVGGAMDFRDIANVQILRGPQGTLFGRNTIGGAVVLTTQNPGDELGGSVKVGIGEDSLFEFLGAIDIPLSETLKSRFTYGARKRDGYVFQGDGTDLGDENTYTVTAKILWEPNDDFRMTIKADYTEEDENGVPLVFAGINENTLFPAQASVFAGCPGAVPFVLGPGGQAGSVPAGIVDNRCANNATWDKGPFTSGGTVDLESTLENRGLAAIANWDLSEEWSVKSVTSYRELDWTGKRDGDNTGLLILHTDLQSTGDQFSQEFQLNYSADKLNGVLGVFYYEDQNTEAFYVEYPFPAVPVAGSAAHEEIAINIGDIENSNWAVFGQATYDFTDQLSLTFGVRHTEEDKAMQLDSRQEALTGPSFLVRNVDLERRELNFTDTSIAANIAYRWNESFMTYLSYSEAFKGGGWNSLYNAPQPDLEPTSFDQENAKSVELGFKADLFGNLRLNGAIFSTDYNDLQFVYRVGPVPLLFNAGTASIDGAELELTFAPTDRLMIEGSVGYLDAQVDEVSTIVGSTTSVTEGSSLPYAPDLTANVGIAYTFDISELELTPRIDYSVTDSQFFDSGNTVEIAQNDLEGLLNLSLTLQPYSGVWKLVAGVTNVTDEAYPVAGNSSLTTGSGYAEVAYQRPRFAFVNLEYQF